MSKAAFYLEHVEVFPSQSRLRSASADCRIEPKIMAALVFLTEHPNVVMSRDSLLQGIWGDDEGASDEGLTRLVSQLRKVFARLQLPTTVLRTVPKFGYMLEATISLPDDVADASIEEREQAFLHRMSVAVKPLTDLSDNAANLFLSEGMTRDLRRLLSLVPRLLVASEPINPQSFSKLDVLSIQPRFEVSGTFVQSGQYVRLRMELIEVSSREVVWSNRYDTKLDRFFEIQEDVVLQISTAISAKVKLSVQPLQFQSRQFDLSAYELVQVTEALRRNYSRPVASQIIEHLRQADKIASGNALVEASLAVQLSQSAVSQWVADPQSTLAEASELAESALRASPLDADITVAAGIVAAMSCRPDDAIEHLERALLLNPNDAHALAVLGWQMCLRHVDRQGLRMIETAEKRAPHHQRFALWATYRATAQIFMLDYIGALAACKDAITRSPNYYQVYLTQAWALAGAGRQDECAASVAKACLLEKDDIVRLYIGEMRRWTENCPNAVDCNHALDHIVD